MNNQYKLTIIISNYNQEKHLSETIDSVFTQVVDYPYKVIITDDCSCKDQSREIIRKYAKKYENIEPIFGSENKGYLTNILRALTKTDTKYFCLLDADDYWTDKCFLQRAYIFLETHENYSIYEANVEVAIDGKEYNRKLKHPFVSTRHRSGTYSKEGFLNGDNIPITQTTGMVLRNTIFVNGIPNIMSNAVGTRSEKSYEGDAGRFIMHLKTGLAYYDKRIVGVYRLTNYGLWSSLPESKKYLISARVQLDYYQYYDSQSTLFINKAYRYLQKYIIEKKKELDKLNRSDKYFDDEELLKVEDVYQFCKEHENEIVKDKNGIIEKAKQIYRILRL